MNPNLEYTIVLPSSDSKLLNTVFQHVQKKVGKDTKFKIVKKDGKDYPSFSKLINDCILLSTTEVVLICADRCRPTELEIHKMIQLIKHGYGIVALWRFAFFGFKKEVIRRIGFFDEKFKGGWWSDWDMMRRLKFADIALYESQEGAYNKGPTRWNLPIDSEKYYFSKWHEPGLKERLPTHKYIVRQQPDPVYDYDIGELNGNVFLPWDQSKVLPQSEYLINLPRYPL